MLQEGVALMQCLNMLWLATAIDKFICFCFYYNKCLTSDEFKLILGSDLMSTLKNFSVKDAMDYLTCF